MTTVASTFSLLAAAGVLWAIVASLAMGAWLSGHGVSIHWVFYRALMPWYVHRYRTMTRERDGRTGPLFLHFVVAINLALLFAVAALIALAAARG